MVSGIIGQKIGMTQVFDAEGKVQPATVLKAGPCVVVQRKNSERDGYEAVQLGLVENRPVRVSKPVAGLYARANVPPTRVRRELPVTSDGDIPAEGEQVLVSLFEPGDQVDVTGVSRGKGFQGVMKRHGFSGGGASHGSMFHRAPGSIGQSSYPSRVIKGMRGPGRMGADPVKNLNVIEVDAEKHMVIVTGAVPGAPGTYVVIRKAVSPRRRASQVVENVAKKKGK